MEGSLKKGLAVVALNATESNAHEPCVSSSILRSKVLHQISSLSGSNLAKASGLPGCSKMVLKPQTSDMEKHAVSMKSK